MALTTRTRGEGLGLARRLDGVSESATLKLNAAVQAMRARGVDVINLTAGEPDFFPPEEAKEAVIESIRLNRCRYTPAPGISELRSLIAEKTNRQQPSLTSGADGKPWSTSDVVVTNGGKQALFNAFLALLDPGDEVLIPAPYWLSYPEMVKIAGGIPKFIGTTLEQGFKIVPVQLRKALEQQTGGESRYRMLILNSPGNPTGAMYSRAELAALGDVLLTTPGAENIWVMSDEIYDRISFGKIPFCSFLEACPELRERTITVNGLSKSAAMTGWRIGWSVAPSMITQGMITLQGQSTSGINVLAQWAGVAALKLPESDFTSHVESLRKRRDLTLEILRKAGKIKLFTPEGAFYIFVWIGNYLRGGEDSVGFAERLLEDAKVSVVPGTPFGEPEYIRISFATDEKALLQGCKRLVDYVS